MDILSLAEKAGMLLVTSGKDSLVSPYEMLEVNIGLNTNMEQNQNGIQ